jgi:hypothetical protein
MGQSRLQRRYPSRHYPEGTTAHESRQALIDVTRPQESGETMSGQPTYISDASPELARAIFSGLRPEVQAIAPWSPNPSDENYALPPVPPDFIPSPLVVGQDTAKLFSEFAAINPEIKRFTGNITTGPTRGYMNRQIAAGRPEWLGYKLNAFPSTYSPQSPETLLGIHHFPDEEGMHEMYINPYLKKQHVADVMGHELGHGFFSTGKSGEGEDMSNRLAALLRQLSPPKPDPKTTTLLYGRPLTSFLPEGGRGGRIPHSKRIEDIR